MVEFYFVFFFSLCRTTFRRVTVALLREKDARIQTRAQIHQTRKSLFGCGKVICVCLSVLVHTNQMRRLCSASFACSAIFVYQYIGESTILFHCLGREFDKSAKIQKMPIFFRLRLTILNQIYMINEYFNLHRFWNQQQL